MDCAFYIRAFRGAFEYTWKYRSISSNSPAQLEIKDMINEVKYGRMSLINCGLVMTPEVDKRFLSVWLLYYVSNFADSRIIYGGAKISIKSYMRSFFPTAFSSSEVLGKNNCIRSKLPTAT